MNNILKHGNHLEYKPNLKLKCTVDTVVNKESNTNTYIVIQLNDNKPSMVIRALSDVTNNINAMLKGIYDRLSKKSLDKFPQALNNMEYDKAKSILKNHRNDINGNSSLEIYYMLYMLNNEISDFNKLYCKLYYGNEINYNEAENIDNGLICKLVKCDIDANKINVVNYGALNIDVQLSRLAFSHANILKSYAEKLYGIALDIKDYGKLENVSKGFGYNLKMLFNNALCDNKSDIVKIKSINDSSVINKSLYNVYNKRKLMLKTLDTSLDINGVGNTEYKSIVAGYLNKSIIDAYNSITDFQKAINLSALYRDNYLSSFKIKNGLREIYKLA